MSIGDKFKQIAERFLGREITHIKKIEIEDITNA